MNNFLGMDNNFAESGGGKAAINRLQAGVHYTRPQKSLTEDGLANYNPRP
jgi:hypothetical protein